MKDKKPEAQVGISQPIIDEKPDGYIFHWLHGDEQNIAVSLTHLIEKPEKFEAEIEIGVNGQSLGKEKHLDLIAGVRFNLFSSSGRKNIENACIHNSFNEQLRYYPWHHIVEQVSTYAIRKVRDGGAVEEIWPAEDDTLEPEYLLAPLVYLNHPTVLFGDYGSLKSLIALVTAYVVQLPYDDNALGLTTANESIKCLYLDYEDDSSSFRKRWSSLERGFTRGSMPILYRRMTATLADSVEQVKKLIADNRIGLLIVDSLGPAARGNLNESEPAMQYHAALRKFGIASLTLAHTSKDQLTRKRSIFGSVYFTNLSRSVWECKAEQETGEDEAIISLKHTKANLSRLHPPLGYSFSFADNSIKVVKSDLRDTGLSGELPLPWQIKNLLSRGSLTEQQICEELNDSKPDSIGRTLRRMRKNNQAQKLEEDTWGLSLF